MFRRTLIGAAALSLAALVPASPALAAETCTVDAATLDWGFKESFRSYLSGTIANGEWTVADGATYSTPEFGFSGGTGELPGTVSFPGSIRFTGHGGILDTTVSNPRLRFDGSSTATLLLDVAGTTQEGEPVDEVAVEFATIDVSSSVRATDEILISDAPAVLTEAGAAAFGTYEPGEPLDPLTATLPTAEDCALVAGPDSKLALVVVGVVFAAIVGLAVLTAVVVVIVLARRERRPGSSSSR